MLKKKKSPERGRGRRQSHVSRILRYAIYLHTIIRPVDCIFDLVVMSS